MKIFSLLPLLFPANNLASFSLYFIDLFCTICLFLYQHLSHLSTSPTLSIQIHPPPYHLPILHLFLPRDWHVWVSLLLFNFSSSKSRPFTSAGFEGECCNFIWVLLSPNLDSHTSLDLRGSDTAAHLFRCNLTTYLPWLILLHLSVSQCMFLKYHWSYGSIDPFSSGGEGEWREVVSAVAGANALYCCWWCLLCLCLVALVGVSIVAHAFAGVFALPYPIF